MKLPLRAVRSSGWPTHLYDADGQYVATFARAADAAELVRLASAGSAVYRQGDDYEIDVDLDRRLDELAAAWNADDDGPSGDDRKPWKDRLEFAPAVSDSSPCVKGTWVTADHVVTLIVDGWTWSDVLRDHPELCEDDVRACLAYAVENDMPTPADACTDSPTD